MLASQLLKKSASVEKAEVQAKAKVGAKMRTSDLRSTLTSTPACLARPAGQPSSRAWGGDLCGHGFTRLVVGSTVFLSSPYDSLSAEWGLVAGDHGALAFARVIVVVEEDPVLRFLQAMGQRRV